jgi:PEGA domain
MKCHHCSHEVKLWQTFCPSCGSRQQGKSFSTIAEAPIPMEPQPRRQLLRKTLQLALLALAIIVLASVARFSPPQANPVVKDTAALAAPTPPPAPLPVASPAPVVPLPAAPPVSAETKLSPINFLTDVMGLRPTANAAAPKLSPGTAARPKSTVAEVSTDDVLPQKARQPVAPAQPVLPAAPATAPPEADPNLEVDTAHTLLQANVGLVSIKSYVPARVYIDGVYSGVTPRSVKLLAGAHSISLLAGGYHEYSRTVKVSGQQQIGILASLSKK